MFVRRINQIEKIRRDAERKFVIGEARAGDFLRRERGHQAFELFPRTDAVLELPAPVIPIAVRHVAPEATTGGTELFQKLRSLVRGGVLSPPKIHLINVHLVSALLLVNSNVSS